MTEVKRGTNQVPAEGVFTFSIRPWGAVAEIDMFRKPMWKGSPRMNDLSNLHPKEAVQAKNPSFWKLMFWHHPPFCCCVTWFILACPTSVQKNDLARSCFRIASAHTATNHLNYLSPNKTKMPISYKHLTTQNHCTMQCLEKLTRFGAFQTYPLAIQHSNWKRPMCRRLFTCWTWCVFP